MSYLNLDKFICQGVSFFVCVMVGIINKFIDFGDCKVFQKVFCLKDFFDFLMSVFIDLIILYITYLVGIYIFFSKICILYYTYQMNKE